MRPLAFMDGHLAAAHDEFAAERCQRRRHLLAVFVEHRLVLHRLRDNHIGRHDKLPSAMNATMSFVATEETMQDRQIGDVRVTRIEEQMGPGFPAKDFFPEFEAETFAAEQGWLAPGYSQPESGKLVTSIHSWLVRTADYTILIDSCSGNHKPRP